ncbi:MAG TPA: nuclear transport factor 2 family protein [Kofleriaceae bacterium]
MNDQPASITERNRKLVEGIFAELARNNPSAFADALADDVRWITPGSSVWSRTFAGKRAVLDELLGMVRAQLVERVRLTVHRILADGDHVVLQATGRATTKTGKPYNNDYCFLFRIAGGKIAEVTEYHDTELASAALQAPWAAAPASA